MTVSMTDTDVAIVGAGAAGLAAAKTLSEQRFRAANTLPTQPLLWQAVR